MAHNAALIGGDDAAKGKVVRSARNSDADRKDPRRSKKDLDFRDIPHQLPSHLLCIYQGHCNDVS